MNLSSTESQSTCWKQVRERSWLGFWGSQTHREAWTCPGTIQERTVFLERQKGILVGNLGRQEVVEASPREQRKHRFEWI